MKLEKRQAEKLLTDRALAKKAGVSTATIHRAKRGDGETRPDSMEKIAAALDIEVEDVDQFREAMFARMYRTAMARGAPDVAIEEAEHLQELFEVKYPGEELVKAGALRGIVQAMDYLDRRGRSDLVNKAIQERQQKKNQDQKKEN